MSPKTKECVEAMVSWVGMGKKIVPGFWSHDYPRNTVAAAIRHLKKEGKIAVLYTSDAGNNVYCNNN